jgi:hypothetical protein
LTEIRNVQTPSRRLPETAPAALLSTQTLTFCGSIPLAAGPCPDLQTQAPTHQRDSEIRVNIRRDPFDAGYWLICSRNK